MTAANARPDGQLLADLTPEEASRHKAGRDGVQPVVGAAVNLWRLGGRWVVWSTGPDRGTWWVQAADDLALRLVQDLNARPSLGAPVVRQVWKDCIAVRTKDIRLGGAR